MSNLIAETNSNQRRAFHTFTISFSLNHLTIIYFAQSTYHSMPDKGSTEKEIHVCVVGKQVSSFWILRCHIFYLGKYCLWITGREMVQKLFPKENRFLFASELQLMCRISMCRREKGTSGRQFGAARRNSTGNVLEKIQVKDRIQTSVY